MTDQIPADKVRPILDEWERIKEYADWVDMDNLVQEVRALLPAPTLADMTPDERAACRWMQCEVRGDRRIITLIRDDDHSYAVTLAPSGYTAHSPFESVTPRPDLPRMTWPGDTPAPALPEEWRLADHQKYGRVIVTNPTPDEDGHVYFVAPTTGAMGNDWHLCAPDELAYLDTDNQAQEEE